MKVYINGIEYEAERDFSIVEQAGNKTASEISVVVENQPFPRAGDVIEFKDGTKTLFWGLCGIPKSPKYKTGLEKKIYKIACQNANSILANRIINEAYQGYSVSEIVTELYTKYVQAEGISLGLISNIPTTLEVYTVQDFNLQDALNELADLVGGTWKVGADRRFYFVVTNDFPVFPHVFDNDFLYFSSLQHSTKSYKMRTVQYIDGASDTTGTQEEAYTYDGEQLSFTLVFPVAAKPAIYINGVQLSASRIGVTGLDDTDPNIVFLFSYNSQTISYKIESAFLTASDSVEFRYIGIYPIRVAAYNATKIAEIAAKTGTSGLIEQVRIDTQIKTTADATQLATSLLEQFSDATGEVRLWLLSDHLYEIGLTLDDLGVLTKVQFDLPAWGVTGDYVVVERKLTPFYADLTSVWAKLKVELRLVNRNYLKSYAETISDLASDISQLTVRADDIVINSTESTEHRGRAEQMFYNPAITFFPTTSTTVSNGSLFAPLDFGLSVYPEGI